MLIWEISIYFGKIKYSLIFPTRNTMSEVKRYLIEFLKFRKQVFFFSVSVFFHEDLFL